jgi:catechol 2,3-dioxygenase-like lactoylglutathione lyase family enzyme
MSIRVLGIDHLVLRTRDLAGLVRFYCDALGCTVERRRDELGLVHLRAGRSMIDLVDVAGPLGQLGAEGKNLDHFALRIESFDADALRAHLIAHGATPGAVMENFGAEGTGPSLYVRDPDGNTVELKGPPR